MSGSRHSTQLFHLALSGILTRSFIHEINHSLSPLNFSCASLSLLLEREDLANDLRYEFEVCISDINRALHRLTDISRIYSHLLVGSQQNKSIENTISFLLTTLSHIADRLFCRLTFINQRVPDSILLHPELQAEIIIAIIIAAMKIAVKDRSMIGVEIKITFADSNTVIIGTHSHIINMLLNLLREKTLDELVAIEEFELAVASSLLIEIGGSISSYTANSSSELLLVFLEE